MNLKIIRKFILITIILSPQYLASVKSSHPNEYQFNHLSDKLLISGWKPSSDKNKKGKKASDKTLKSLKKFKKMWAAVYDNDFATAAKEMLDSRWARQVKGRSTRLAHAMATGEMA